MEQDQTVRPFYTNTHTYNPRPLYIGVSRGVTDEGVGTRSEVRRPVVFVEYLNQLSKKKFSLSHQISDSTDRFRWRTGSD